MQLQSPGSEALPLVNRLPAHSLGNSLWAGVELIGPVTEAGEPMPGEVVSARMEFAPTSDGRYPLHALSSTPLAGEGSVTIVGAPGDWTFSIPPQPLPLPIGLWFMTLRVTTDDGAAQVIYRGTIIVTA